MGNKREGDGCTPRGIHHVVGMLYRPDRLPCPAPWAQPIRNGDLWCDDSAHPAYNQLVSAPFSGSHEQLRRADPLYDIVLILNWNYPEASQDQGSAIFVHQWRRPGYPTEGCIALSRRNLLRIAGLIEPGTRVVVAH